MDWTLIVQIITASAVGLVLIAVIVGIVLSVRHNTRFDAALQRLLGSNASLLHAVEEQAEEARVLAEKTNEERAFASRPILILLDEPPEGIREQPWAAVRVRNVGNGPALNFVVWMLGGGDLYRSAGAVANGFSGALHLAPGDIFEPGPHQNMLLVAKAGGYLDPGPAVVDDNPAGNLMAYCGDHFGNRYRFNLRTADPPEVWERGAAAPPWAGAWDPRLSSGEAGSPQLQTRAAPPAHGGGDMGSLLETLREVIERLEGAAADTDVSITGRAARRPLDIERRTDFDARP